MNVIPIITTALKTVTKSFERKLEELLMSVKIALEIIEVKWLIF